MSRLNRSGKKQKREVEHLQFVFCTSRKLGILFAFQKK